MTERKVSSDRLREARVYLSLTRDQVSGAMQRERRWVDDIEHGRHRVTGEELRKLSRLCGPSARSAGCAVNPGPS